MMGRIHSVQTMGTVDGPGIRCVVFFQGCPLRCGFCHNPDTWDVNGGIEVSAEQLLNQILRVKPYFGKEGGVTISGGEPLMQAQFAAELFHLCKQKGIHTALDTSGCILNEQTRKVSELADLILLDIKFKNESLYQQYTGGSMQPVIELLQFANSRNKPVWVRQVILPGINDNKEDVRALCELLKPFQCIQKLELLPFCKLCLEKYQALNIPFAMEHLPEAKPNVVATLQSFAYKCLFHTSFF